VPPRTISSDGVSVSLSLSFHRKITVTGRDPGRLLNKLIRTINALPWLGVGLRGRAIVSYDSRAIVFILLLDDVKASLLRICQIVSCVWSSKEARQSRTDSRRNGFCKLELFSKQALDLSLFRYRIVYGSIHCRQKITSLDCQQYWWSGKKCAFILAREARPAGLTRYAVGQNAVEEPKIIDVHFFGTDFQFNMSTMGVMRESSMRVLMRNRPSGETAYCGRRFACPPVATRV